MKCNVCISFRYVILIFMTNLQERYQSHFTAVETEVQGGEETCPSFTLLEGRRPMPEPKLHSFFA